MPEFVVITRTNSPSPIGYREPLKDFKSEVIEAETAELAARSAVGRVSVWDVEHGVQVEVFTTENPVSKFHAQYDGKALNESHGATGAKLVFSQVLDVDV